MGLDRDELAARCLASMLSCSGRTGRASDYAEDAVDAADALLSALSPPVAVAPAKYEPKPGDVVSLAIDDGSRVVRVAISHDEYAMVREGQSGGVFRFDTFGRAKYGYLRPATLAERAAAGLPVEPGNSTVAPDAGFAGLPEKHQPTSTPAPEAKRPEWVRIVSTDSPSLKVGDVRRVKEWDRDNFPWVEHEAYPDYGHALIQTKWEPCDAPAPTPPAPSREEALKACVDALVDVRDRLSVSQRLDLRPTIDAALALARAATKGGA